MADWEQFARNGDEFLVAYASAPPLTSVTLFLVGHAVELYLKAAFAAKLSKTKNIEELVDELKAKYSHNVKKIWDELKHDTGFMPNFQVREDLYARDFMDLYARAALSSEDLSHLSEYGELYLIFKRLQELKYLFLPWGSKVLTFAHPNPFWIKFFSELRSYLDYPRAGVVDHLIPLTNTLSLTTNVTVYLAPLQAKATALPSRLGKG